MLVQRPPLLAVRRKSGLRNAKCRKAAV